jgi:hypothetical protein
MGKATHLDTTFARRIRAKSVSPKANLRNQQRVRVSSDITIERPDGQCLNCRIANLSRSGVMVSCSEEAAKALLPGLITPAPGQAVDVTTRFSVPVLPTQPVVVAADGSVVHMRRMSRNEFHIGIQFTEFEGNGFDYVDRYVAKLLADLSNPEPGI